MMRIARRGLRLGVGAALVFGFLLLHASMGLADGTSTITIHKAECPTGVGSQIFEKCHGNGLGGVNFAIGPSGGEQVYTTDDNGVIGPITVPAGPIHITEDPATVAKYLGVYVYCRDLTTNTVLFDSDLNGSDGLHGSNPAGANVVCDWYDITPAASDNGGGTDAGGGGTGTGGDTTGGGGAETRGATSGGTTAAAATTLPVTGIGAPDKQPSPILPVLAILALAALAGAHRLRRR